MNKFNQLLIKNKYKTILFSQAFLLILLILVLGFVSVKSANNDFLLTSILLTAIGYLSILIYPFLWVQKKITKMLHNDYKQFPSSEKIFNFFFLFLIYLSIFGGILLILTFVFKIDIVPVYFSIPGVAFVFALIGDRK